MNNLIVKYYHSNSGEILPLGMEIDGTMPFGRDLLFDQVLRRLRMKCTPITEMTIRR